MLHILTPPPQQTALSSDLLAHLKPGPQTSSFRADPFDFLLFHSSVLSMNLWAYHLDAATELYLQASFNFFSFFFFF